MKIIAKDLEIGQVINIEYGAEGNFTQAEIMKIAKYKTSISVSVELKNIGTDVLVLDPDFEVEMIESNSEVVGVLEVVVSQTPGVIDFNYEQLRKGIQTKAQEYANKEVTEENKPDAKKDVAHLRGIVTKLDVKRKEVKKEIAKPYDALELKFNVLKELLNEPIGAISKQIKELEDKERKQKKDEIERIFNDAIGDLGEYLSLEGIYNPKWDNKAMSLKSITEEITTVVDSTRMAVDTISEMQSGAVTKALEQYKQNLDLASAIKYINDYEKQRAEILAKQIEQRKADEAKKAKEEIERVRKEEREKVANEERIREEERRKTQAEIELHAEMKLQAEQECLEEQESETLVSASTSAFLEICNPSNPETDGFDELEDEVFRLEIEVTRDEKALVEEFLELHNIDFEEV